MWSSSSTCGPTPKSQRSEAVPLTSTPWSTERPTVAGPADVAAIAFMHHQTRKEAVDLVAETAAWLEADGHEVRIRKEDAAGALSRWAIADEALLDGLDLAVSVGGDGTMLRTVHLVCGAGVPVMGVNVGHMGYLTEFEPDGMRDALRRWLSGDHRTESRMTLEV